MKLRVHEALVREGFDAAGEPLARWEADVGCGGAALVPLGVVVRGNRRQDSICGQADPARHVDCAAFSAAAERLAMLWQIVGDRDLELTAGWDRAAARQALLALGAITHTVQDMAAHSNWVEVHTAARSPVPAWDWRAAPVPTGPAPVLSGTWFMARRCADGDWPAEVPREQRPSHGALNKDHGGSRRGSQAASGGGLYFEHARELALRHTVVEIEHLATAAPNLRRWIHDGAGEVCMRPPPDAGRELAALRDAVVRREPRVAARHLAAVDRAGPHLAAAAVGGLPTTPDRLLSLLG